MLIWLLRHGLSEAGERGVYEGSGDTPLSARGRAQLKRAALAPNTVYITDKRRTAETAALLFPEAETRIADGLEEMNFGVFEGRSWRDMAGDAAYRAWVDGDCRGRCPGGEDRASFSERVCRSFRQLVGRESAAGSAELVIVAHGGTQMAVLERWGRPERTYYAWRARPGCGYLLDAGRWPEALDVLEDVCFAEAEE